MPLGDRLKNILLHLQRGTLTSALSFIHLQSSSHFKRMQLGNK